MTELTNLMDEAGAGYRICDKRNSGVTINVAFNGKLQEEQQSAADTMLDHEIGVLHAATAFGKTVVAEYLIAKRSVNTLIIVPNATLMSQWKESLNKFLSFGHPIPEQSTKQGNPKKRDTVGILGKGRNTLNNIVDIAIYKSLLENDGAKDFVKDYGMVIVDECHHVGAYSYEQTLNHVNAKYVYGVTATPMRSDGLDAIIFFHCGPVRFKTNLKEQIKRHGFEHVMIPRFTSLRPIMLSSLNNIPSIYNDLAKAESRNRKILGDIIKALRDDRTPLVLTERIAHMELLAEALKSEVSDTDVLCMFGGQSANEKRILEDRLSASTGDRRLVIVATSKSVGEGFDLPSLDTLFLTMPIRWEGRLEQYIGRLHRNFEGKKEVCVYDYIDVQVPVLERMYRVRLRGYAHLGYTVKSELGAQESIGMIYHAGNYKDALKRDMEEAVKRLAMAGPKITKSQKSELLKHLQSSDITPEILPSELRFIIIDRRIVWYGAVNYFGKNIGDETCLRIDNQEVAEELLEFAQGSV
jgi:superfamily II DNA or RNA helicase